MELPGFIKTIHAKVEDDGHWLTRRKLALFGLTLILTGLLAGVFEAAPEPDSTDFSEIIDLSLPKLPAPLSVPTEIAAGGPQSQLGLEPGSWKSVTVRSGQTLDAIFRQQGYSVALLHRILALNNDTKGLTRIRPGDVFDFRADDAGELAEMRYPLDEARYLIVRQLGRRTCLRKRCSAKSPRKSPRQKGSSIPRCSSPASRPGSATPWS